MPRHDAPHHHERPAWGVCDPELLCLCLGMGSSLEVFEGKPVMLLKVVATGRQWGDKIDEKVTRQMIGGVPCIVREFDGWDGGEFDGKTLGPQQFYRFTVIEPEKPIRDDRK